MKRKSAFTLIELLIVVAIIGILAAIAVPNFLNAQLRAKIARNQADMKSVSTSILMFRADTGFFPVDHWDDDHALGCERLDKLNQVGKGPDCESRNTFAVLAVITSPISYMSALPSDPFFNSVGDEDQTYRYGDYESGYPAPNHNINALKPENAIQFGLRPLALNDFVLIGSGPDRTFGSGGDASDIYRGIPYDSSNGLISLGHITMRGSGG